MMSPVNQQPMMSPVNQHPMISPANGQPMMSPGNVQPMMSPVNQQMHFEQIEQRQGPMPPFQFNNVPPMSPHDVPPTEFAIPPPEFQMQQQEAPVQQHFCFNPNSAMSTQGSHNQMVSPTSQQVPSMPPMEGAMTLEQIEQPTCDSNMMCLASVLPP